MDQTDSASFRDSWNSCGGRDGVRSISGRAGGSKISALSKFFRSFVEKGYP